MAAPNLVLSGVLTVAFITREEEPLEVILSRSQRGIFPVWCRPLDGECLLLPADVPGLLHAAQLAIFVYFNVIYGKFVTRILKRVNFFFFFKNTSI